MKLIAVVGTGLSAPETDHLAERAGAAIARAGFGVVCGGLAGTMEAACRGAKSVGGTTVGILPSQTAADANRYVDIAIPTGMSEARNVVVVTCATGVLAIGGSYGTLSEIALALKLGRPLVAVRSWKLAQDPTGSGVTIDEFEEVEPALERLLEQIL